MLKQQEAIVVERFDVIDTGTPYQPWRELVSENDGEWVRFEDYEKLEVEVILAALAELKDN